VSEDAHREHWLERFRAQAPGGPAWLASLRRKAVDHFAEAGFPHVKLEAWRHTNPAPLVRVPFEAPREAAAEIDRGTLERICFPVFACSVFVFVNGRYAPALSTTPALGGWLGVSSLARDLAERPDAREGALGARAGADAGAFAALNTAFFEDGARVRVEAGADLGGEPIHLVFITAPGGPPAASHPRVVVEDHVSLAAGDTLTNAVTEIDVAENASLEWIKVQREDPTAFHVAGVHARVARDGRLAAHTLSFGTRLTRNDARVTLADAGAQAELRGLFVAGADQLVDNHTWVDHARPHGTSRELYKGVLDGRARGVFNGRVVVRPDAQKTDAVQRNANLLLSRQADIATQPQLEIHADDVKCSHGSTVGQLDPDAMFYLRSRGLGEAEARDLLMRGFVSEITRGLSVAPLSERVEDLVVERLGMARALPGTGGEDA
jgi:Fe-S cluster assembly protein SufD